MGGYLNDGGTIQKSIDPRRQPHRKGSKKVMFMNPSYLLLSIRVLGRLLATGGAKRWPR